MWHEIKQVISSDRNVSKFIFSRDDAIVESVLYKYPTYEDRTVICCSTQSGCAMGCRFCGSGDYFVRSLTSDEIVSQPEYLLKSIGYGEDTSIINKLQIMFMSMGEPMNNFKEVATAIRSLNVKYPNASLLLSTSAPRTFSKFEELNDLSREITKVGLQFSVHESTDKARKSLIPAPTMTLEEISDTGYKWFLSTNRKPFFNYCLHDKNNTVQDVERLHKLFNPSTWEATLSVICERNEHIAAANDRQRKLAQDFSALMLNKGFNVRVFNPAGQDDIGGGCGQLWFVQDWMKSNPSLTKPSAGYGLPSVHTPR